jgi:hypothetical protein
VIQKLAATRKGDGGAAEPDRVQTKRNAKKETGDSGTLQVRLNRALEQVAALKDAQKVEDRERVKTNSGRRYPLDFSRIARFAADGQVERDLGEGSSHGSWGSVNFASANASDCFSSGDCINMESGSSEELYCVAEGGATSSRVLSEKTFDDGKTGVTSFEDDDGEAGVTSRVHCGFDEWREAAEDVVLPLAMQIMGGLQYLHGSWFTV